MHFFKVDDLLTKHTGAYVHSSSIHKYDVALPHTKYYIVIPTKNASPDCRLYIYSGQEANDRQ